MENKWVQNSNPFSAMVYTLVETARANDLDPYALRVLALMAYNGKDPTPEELDLFMPWNPQLKHAAREI